MKNVQLKEALKSIPLLNPVMLASKEGKFYVSSHTSVYAVMSIFDVADIPPFNAVLSPEAAKNLSKLVSGVKEADVHMEVKDKNLHVASGRKKAVFTLMKDKTTIDAALKVRDETFSPNVSMRVEDLSDAMQAVSHYSGDKSIADVRFHGYHMYVGKDKIEFMSSNNKGMSIAECSTSSNMEPFITLVPKEFQSLIRGSRGDISLQIENGKRIVGRINTSTHEVRFISTLVNSTPLPYRGILPDSTQVLNTIRVSKKELQDAFAEGDFFSPDDKYCRVRFNVALDSINIKSANPENGSIEVDVPASADKEEAFDISYGTLAQLLGNSTNDILIIEVYSKRVVIKTGSMNILAKFDVDNASQ